jgi:glycosyltransferase involved in cell wall biosynthesis
MNKPTVTVAVPAYNEEANIGSILESLLLQKQKKVILKDIWVYTDGSKDRTPQIAEGKAKSSKLIKVVKGKTQKGKFYRLNQIFRANKSDALIVLDADIGLVGKYFVENFALALLKDKKAQLVSAHEVPLLPKDFVGRVIASSYVMWDYIRLSVPKGDHVQNLYARATAYRKEFAKGLYIPDEATEERLYLYLMAKKADGYRLTYDAVIKYWPVTTIYDYVKLSERAFGRPQPAVNKLFGYDATYHYLIPRKYKIWGTIKSFVHDPFYTPLAFVLGYILSKKTLDRKTLDSQIWEVSLSSKRKISYEK